MQFEPVGTQSQVCPVGHRTILLYMHMYNVYDHIYVQYLTCLSLHTCTIAKLQLTTVYIVSEVHCTSNVHVLQYTLILCYHIQM